MKFYKVIVVYFLSLIIFGCNKEDSDNNVNVQDTTSGNNNLVFLTGVDQGVLLVNLDSHIYSTSFIQHNFDLNADQIQDLGVLTGVGGSQGTGYHGITDLMSLHDSIEFWGQINYDTVYNCIDTFYSAGNGNPSVLAEIYNNRYCYLDTIPCTVSSASVNFRPVEIPYASPINTSAVFESDTFRIRYRKYQYFPVYTVQNDTGYTLNRKFDETCRDFPLSTPLYLVFRMWINGTPKYGWLWIEVLSTNYIHIKEYAIEP